MGTRPGKQGLKRLGQVREIRPRLLKEKMEARQRALEGDRREEPPKTATQIQPAGATLNCCYLFQYSLHSLPQLAFLAARREAEAEEPSLPSALKNFPRRRPPSSRPVVPSLSGLVDRGGGEGNSFVQAAGELLPTVPFAWAAGTCTHPCCFTCP